MKTLFIFILVSVWNERFFDYVTLTSEEIGLKEEVRKINVFSYEGGNLYLLPFQVDDVKITKGVKNYVMDDGVFDGKDELVFPARYCGERIKSAEVFQRFEAVFEVEVWDSSSKRYCYVGVRENLDRSSFVNLPAENARTVKKGSELLVFQDSRCSVFDDLRPVVKSIRVKRGDEYTEVFLGMKAEIYIELLNLIKIRKTEQDLYAKPLFMKVGDLRVVRVIKPYADLGFGIKIPGANTVSYIYRNFMYVENAVPIPFELKHLSRHSHAIFYLTFLRPRRFISEKNKVELGEKPTEANEDGHMWGFVEGDFWSSAYFIREMTPIPIKRVLYYKDEGGVLHVGINLNILELPRGEHSFAMYGFFMPPGDLSAAKRLVFDPLRFKVRRVM